MQPEGYRVVRLANGTTSIHSDVEDETFHPVIGPAAEARALYVDQLRLAERIGRHEGEFVIWDVGLGAGANVLTVFEATRHLPGVLRVASFDRTPAPLEFALANAAELGYVQAYQAQAAELLKNGRVEFQEGPRRVVWEFHLGDFPTLISDARPGDYPAPHAILFDAFSPAKNPAMWTGPLFARLHQLLDPQRPCAMPTYSRSTMLRVALLLAGFYVGAGHATGEKEETTIAANALELLETPLPSAWLRRARYSRSAEPLWEPAYRQAPISEESWKRLLEHPQFNPGAGA
jgi:tRNA U34 5-methylaminomethyl-2-thiouridine-forming methyltransferase MnmC